MEIEVRTLKAEEVPAAADLVGRVFMECVAPLYGPDGIQEVLSYASPESLARRLGAQLLILVAVDPGEGIVGLVAVREHCHISLLFVDSEFQRRGIGRLLVGAAVRACKDVNADLVEMTVHASPNSVEAYERYGFVATGPEQVKNGLRFVPMSLTMG